MTSTGLKAFARPFRLARLIVSFIITCPRDSGLIAVEGVSKKYRIRSKSKRGWLRRKSGPRQPKYLAALDDVDLSVRKGEILGIIGPNGAGKTTLLKILAGLLLPDSGRAIVNNYDIIEQRRKVRTSVNFLTSSGWMIFDYRLSIFFNLKYWGILQGLRLKEVEDKVNAALKLVDLYDRKDDCPENLSAGMRQRMNLARSLLVDRPIYLLDEPTVNIDPYSANFIREFVSSLANEGRSIILVTQNLWEAELLCKRIAFLFGGKILRCGDVDDIKKEIGNEFAIIKVRRKSRELLRDISAMPFVEDILETEMGLKVYGKVGGNLFSILETCRVHTDILDVRTGESSLNDIFIQLAEDERSHD